MILHVHKKRVDRPNFDKIAETYVSSKEYTLRKLGCFCKRFEKFVGS